MKVKFACQAGQRTAVGIVEQPKWMFDIVESGPVG